MLVDLVDLRLPVCTPGQVIDDAEEAVADAEQDRPVTVEETDGMRHQAQLEEHHDGVEAVDDQIHGSHGRAACESANGSTQGPRPHKKLSGRPKWTPRCIIRAFFK